MKVCCAKKSKLEAKELYEKLSVTESIFVNDSSSVLLNKSSRKKKLLFRFTYLS